METLKKLPTEDSFDIRCSVKIVKTSERCPEKPTKKINGDDEAKSLIEAHN